MADPPSTALGSTASSLLDRLQCRDPDAWQRFVDLYGPLVYHWCKRFSLSPEDRADVFQEVFFAVARHISMFRHSPESSFRGWLLTITRHKVSDHFRRKKGQPAVGGGPSRTSSCNCLTPTWISPTMSQLSSHCCYVVPSNGSWVSLKQKPGRPFWCCCWTPASADVATDLDVSINAVYKAKARVLLRLREELRDL